MKIVADKELDEEDIDTYLQGLEMKYGDLDSLIRMVDEDANTDPASKDDRLVWGALLSSLPGIEGEYMTGLSKKTIFNDAGIFNHLTKRRMELLSNVLEEPDPSIKELAGRMGRDYKNTYDDIKALADLGLLSVLRTGRSRTIHAEVSSINIEL